MELARQNQGRGERSLIERGARGDPSAWEELLRAHAPWALRFAYRLLEDHAAAEDVTQAAFLRVLCSLGGFRGSARLRTYLYRVVLNGCRDEMGRRRRHEAAMREAAARAAGQVPAEPADPAARAEAREFDSTVRSLVRRLPTAQRETLVLRAYEGLGYREIAGILGVTVHAVKANLAEARSKLAAWIGSRGRRPGRKQTGGEA